MRRARCSSVSVGLLVADARKVTRWLLASRSGESSCADDGELT